MRSQQAAIVGGIVAGVVTSLVMAGGRKSGALGKTLDRDAVDWIDKWTGSRSVIGNTGTSAIEFINHLGASAAFAAVWPALRRAAPGMSVPTLAVAYGTALYLVNIAAIAPVLGITQGEIQAGPRKAAERWAIHIVQTLVTGLVAERLGGGAAHR